MKKGYIDEILTRWNETSVKSFLEKILTDIYEYTEKDAVELCQLVRDYSKLQKLLNNI
ncbi:MAG: hypothetical protein ACTSQP_08075 [Promethearchaeota archaeon]